MMNMNGGALAIGGRGGGILALFRRAFPTEQFEGGRMVPTGVAADVARFETAMRDRVSAALAARDRATAERDAMCEAMCGAIKIAREKSERASRAETALREIIESDPGKSFSPDQEMGGFEK